MLVPFSRLYLGVHTPLDVGVSIIIALTLIFVIYPLINIENEKGIRILLISTSLLSVLLLLFVSLYKFPDNVDIANLESGTKNAYKMLGCSLGILLAFEIDKRFINFDTSAVLGAQFLKFIIGLIPVLIIKEGLRAPLQLIFNGHFMADGIRYFILVLFAGCIWPLTFKYFSKLFIKSK